MKVRPDTVMTLSVGPDAIEREYADASGYAEFKQDAGGAAVERLSPIRERYLELRSDQGYLEETLAKGAAKAHDIAGQTLSLARERMGITPPMNVS